MTATDGICEEPHETIEEEDACEAERLKAKQPKHFVGKQVALRSLDGFEYAGTVTDSNSPRDAPVDIQDLWLELDSEWWVSMRHVTAARWGEIYDS